MERHHRSKEKGSSMFVVALAGNGFFPRETPCTCFALNVGQSIIAALSRMVLQCPWLDLQTLSRFFRARFSTVFKAFFVSFAGNIHV